MTNTKPDPVARGKSRDNALGQYLRLLRVKSKLTMVQAAELSGVTQGYISQIENGLYQPSGKVLAKLARAYKVQEVQLLRRAGIVDQGMLDRLGLGDSSGETDTGDLDGPAEGNPERLRITPTPLHTEEDEDALIAALVAARDAFPRWRELTNATQAAIRSFAIGKVE